VFLCTYRPWPSILWNIRSLKKQKFKDWELVLVQHGVVLDGYLPRWLRHKTTSLYYASDGVYRPVRIRNLAWRECRGGLIFFMHDFVDLERDDFLAQIWESSENATKAVSTCNRVIDVRSMNQVKFSTRHCKVIKSERPEDQPEIYNAPVDLYFHQDAVPKRALERINGFDPVYDPPGGSHGYDDWDTRDSLLETGCVIVQRGDLFSTKLGTSHLFPLIGDKDASNAALYACRADRQRIFKKVE